MRGISGILLLAIGAFAAMYALYGSAATLLRVTDWIADGDWTRLAKVSLALAVSSAIAWLSLRSGWRRRRDIAGLGGLTWKVFKMIPRIPLAVFLAILAGAFVIAALIVAFVVNPIELPAYAPEMSLSWDPTHTAEKYLFLGVLLGAGAFWIFRRGKPEVALGLLPALMLAVAIPIGAAGYESVSNRWSFAAWHASADEMESLRGDRFVFIADRRADSSFVVRIRSDVLETLQWMRASGFQSDWSGLDEMESEADLRTTTGWLLIVTCLALLGGAGWLLRGDVLAVIRQPDDTEAAP